MKRIIAILLVAVVAVCGLMNRHLIALDGLGGLFFSCGFRDTTAYAHGYSHAGFRKIHAGMGQAELISVMGEPVAIWSREANITTVTNRSGFTAVPAITYIWDYSESTNDSHYRMRQVSVRDGTVIGRHSEYWVD